MRVRQLCLPIILGLLSGCAIGNRTDYLGGMSFNPVIANTTGPVVVAVQDQRPSILGKADSESNVGIQRSLGGIPWAIHTASKRPLAQDLGETITDAMTRHGYNAISVIQAPLASDQDLLAKAKQIVPSGKILHFVLKEWKHETWIHETFSYCVNLVVKDLSGMNYCTVSQCGKEDLFKNNPEFRTIGTAVVTVIDRLIDSPETQRALNNNSPIASQLKR